MATELRTPLLSVENLSVSFSGMSGHHDVLQDVSFSVPAGKIVALVGESGSGKSTIGNAILGLLPAHKAKLSGRIVYRDPATHDSPVDLLKLNDNQMRSLRGRRVSIAFQEPAATLSHLSTIGSQLSEAYFTHFPNAGAGCKQRVLKVLEDVGFSDPQSAYYKYPFELSGGLKQRAMLACALVCEPPLVIADEPTSALDVTVQALALRLLVDLQSRMNLSVLFITHDFGVVANIADYVVVLKSGQVVEAGTVNEIFKSPREGYTRALLKAVPRLSGAPEAFQPVHASADVTQMLAGAWPARDRHVHDHPIVDVADVSKSFTFRHSFNRAQSQTIEAVSSVSLVVRPGECVGLVGESGCGKSTLSRMIMRVLQPDAGRITTHIGDNAVDIARLSDRELKTYRRRVQYVFQDPFASLNPRMSALDIVTEPYVIQGIGSREDQRGWAQALFQLVGLDPQSLNRFPNGFSGGQRQRIGIARALALGPDLLVCDEPVSALDVSVQAQILGLLEGLREDLGIGSLFVSHNLAVVRAVAARVNVMCAGRIVESAPTLELFSAPCHPYTIALLAANPEPDPDRKLNLGALLQGRASDPEAWPERFRLTRGSKPRYECVGPEHFVAVAA